ncbi:MAG TPA: potassium-transporting ATPase subunit C [Actinomycetes bacterium]|nr:potassium-transporting ATPase subunit C [Actinomycetes bacterium]
MSARTVATRVWAAFRVLLVLTVVCGFIYPLAVLAVAQLPGLRHHAAGSLVTVDGKTVGSALIGQAYTDAKGNPLVQYFQSRPSAAGAGYDPDATSASNLGPENIVDTLANPADASDTGKQSLLTQVCSRSKAIGALEDVDGRRPYCTDSGVGAVLGVFFRDGDTGPVTRVVSLNQECPAVPFLATYRGVRVECARYGQDYSKAVITPIRGDAPAHPAVPADAVTASGSGLDPNISLAYADLQIPRVAKARGVTVEQVAALVRQHEKGRALGFLGEPVVDVLALNIALDQTYPYHH